ncbi:polysaccharide deacetylase [Campylobacter mucosalis]|uniref:Polysaccharide deacetylase n=1 Tax=Campylobacter mucosalis CCUG 21559 TaxID=1032067 RepID=A0A6G5QJI0_9BACT|nr:polysaccharide deacetylase family protein [Campylobacter mucosalis]KEA45396.1 polysaccharide deacetylase [Campylobacter mucosalis]QCD45636.1 polysaccharide deacetylase [Campylobacter mucosalis CCUG 21559]QKF63826.1 polysaccharide deacetylase [Campylobacter mucosalis]
MRILFLLVFGFVFAFADAHIFVYHRFDDPKHSSTNISTEILRKQFDYIKQKGYEVVPLEMMVERLKNGEDVPNNWVVLVVDDGYKSFYRNGLPVFKEYGYPFTLFVYVEASARKYGDYMSFDEIKETSKYGDIQYHSYAHLHMVGLDDDRLKQDFSDGIAVFEKYMGKKPKYFAYPYGEYDERVIKKAKEFGFEALLNQNTGAVSAKSDRFDLNRTPLKDETSMDVAFADEYLDAKWIFPKDYPKNNVIDELSIIVDDKNATKAKFFVSGLSSYKSVDIKDGVFYYKFKNPLDKYKVRISLKIGRKTTTKILVKDINNVE